MLKLDDPIVVRFVNFGSLDNETALSLTGASIGGIEASLKFIDSNLK